MPNAAKRAEIKARSANRTAGGAQKQEAPAAPAKAAKAPAADATAKSTPEGTKEPKVKAPAADATAKSTPEGTKEPKVKAPSIRNTIIAMLNDGKSTKEITDVLQAQFPGTKAAEKPSKHIAFYRSRMKKDAAAPAAE